MSVISFSEVLSLLNAGEKFLLLCHTNPDEDTLGSAYGLYLALKAKGKDVKLLCDSRPGRRSVNFLDADAFVLFEPDESFDMTVYDGYTVVSVDVASRNMLGLLKKDFENRIDLKIDHHAIGEDFAVYNYTDASAGACGMIIYSIAQAMGVKDPAMASALYMAIASDTGGFRYSNTTAATHRIAADLLEMGADGAAISEALFETKSERDLRAMQLALTKMRYFCDGLVTLISISNADKEAMMLDDRDLGELPSISRQPDGVLIGMVLKQSDGDGRRFKLSTRSREGFDAAALCQVFGGGGHIRAAGATIHADSMAEAEKLVMDAVYPMIGDLT